MEGNHQQDEKTYRMGEVLATCNLIGGLIPQINEELI